MSQRPKINSQFCHHNHSWTVPDFSSKWSIYFSHWSSWNFSRGLLEKVWLIQRLKHRLILQYTASMLLGSLHHHHLMYMPGHKHEMRVWPDTYCRNVNVVNMIHTHLNISVVGKTINANILWSESSLKTIIIFTLYCFHIKCISEKKKKKMVVNRQTGNIYILLQECSGLLADTRAAVWSPTWVLKWSVEVLY